VSSPAIKPASEIISLLTCSTYCAPAVAGDQPGGEGTGKALGINDDSLFAVFGIVVGSVFFAFAQWQEKQDDDDDFFDAYDSRRVETKNNRNRDDGGRLGESGLTR
jgi:hypothetical protein